MNNASLSELAYHQVRRKILFQELKAGDPVNEQMLAQQMKISRTPVREGVMRLAHEGLVKILPRKGIIVAEQNIETMRLCFEARLPCEIQIARLAALRAKDSDIAAMEAALAPVERLINKRQFNDLLIADEKFHASLAAASHNGLLAEMQHRVYGLGIRFWYATLPQRLPDEIKQEMALHQGVVESIKLRDPDEAERVMAAIIANFPDRVAETIRGAHLQFDKRSK